MRLHSWKLTAWPSLTVGVGWPLVMLVSRREHRNSWNARSIYRQRTAGIRAWKPFWDHLLVQQGISWNWYVPRGPKGGAYPGVFVRPTRCDRAKYLGSFFCASCHWPAGLIQRMEPCRSGSMQLAGSKIACEMAPNGANQPRTEGRASPPAQSRLVSIHLTACWATSGSLSGGSLGCVTNWPRWWIAEGRTTSRPRSTEDVEYGFATLHVFVGEKVEGSAGSAHARFVLAFLSFFCTK